MADQEENDLETEAPPDGNRDPSKQTGRQGVRLRPPWQAVNGTHTDLDSAGVSPIRSCRIPLCPAGVAQTGVAPRKEGFLGTVGEHPHRRAK